MRARIIDRSEVASIARWDFPPVEPPPPPEPPAPESEAPRWPTAGELEELQRQVQEEAHKRGYAEGLAAAKAEIAAAVARLEQLASALAQPLAAVDAAVEEELVGLALALASHLVRREIEHDPRVLQAAVHECLSVLPSGARDVTVFLNPDDMALVAAEASSGQARFKIAADPSLQRGDLRVTSSTSVVDGRIETRLAELLRAESPGGVA